MSELIDSADIHGILLLNKPVGLSSHTALKIAQRLLGAKKAGHTGSLDPIATGMLPIFLGEATKFSQFQLNADKIYEATAACGVKTDTSDSTGKVIALCDMVNLNQSHVLTILKKFQGEITQTPSPYSALKHKGRRWYQLAREGIQFERKTRQVMIHEILLHALHSHGFKIRVSCSKGTYIRNLIEDIGEALGTHAHMTALHRVSTAGFNHQVLYTLKALEQMTKAERLHCLLPVDVAVNHIQAYNLNANELLALTQGKRLMKAAPKGLLRAYDERGHFVGIIESDGVASIKVFRLLSTETGNRSGITRRS